MSPENRNHKRVRIIVVNDDAMTFESDVLILKYAQAHYGLDMDVSYKLSRLGVSPELMSPEVESYNLMNSRGGLGARNVLIFGVVSLYEFGYEDIRKFARSSLKALSGNEENFKHVSITLHGVGIGMDEMEAFDSEVAGLIDGITSGEAPKELEQISIVDHDERRAKRLSEALSHLLPRSFIEIDFRNYLKKMEEKVTEKYRSAGYLSATKPHIFVAMPFREDMEDIYDYAISGAVRSAGFLCERADLSSFTGDVMDWVKKRIQSASLLIADLTTANPNVYLEVGFAWGLNVPTVLLVQDANDLKFDVKNQRCIVYKRIKELEEKLQKELSNLSVQVGLSGGN